MPKTTTKKTAPRRPRAPKAVKKESPVESPEKEINEEKGRIEGEYCECIGRRKTSIARVRISTKGDRAFIVNGKPLADYFPTLDLQETAQASLKKMNCADRFRVTVVVKGGGIHGQAEAVRHGLARALVVFNADFRKRLKKAGFLTRDPRMRERKKFGLKRARKGSQWAKR